MDRFNRYPETDLNRIKSTDTPDPTYDLAEMREKYVNKMNIVETAAKNCDPAIGKYIFEAVTKNLSFPYFQTNGIPCGKGYFYEKYRKFFYILSWLRD